MALDMERPSSVHSPDEHSLSGSIPFGGGLPHPHPLRASDDRRSPESSLEEERDSSPASGDTAQQHHHSSHGLHPGRRHGGPQPGAVPPTTHSLKFSIEKILSPDFGRPVAREMRDSLPSSLLVTAEAKIENSKKCSPSNMSGTQWPAWVYCTRYSDRPSSGPRRIRSKQCRKSGNPSAGQECSEDDQSPRSRRMKKKEKKPDEKRPRTAFTAEQLTRLKQEFQENRYLTEKRRQDLARDLKLNESQIKIWFQNKRAKIKKASGQRNPLALQLMAQGLYNHSTIPLREDEDDERPKSSSSS